MKTEPSRPVPVEYLCDPANWGYVSHDLVRMEFPAQGTDTAAWMEGIAICAMQFRYQQYLSPSAALAALAPPWLGETTDPYRSYLNRADVDLRSFGVDRPQVAIIDNERFRYFDGDKGWTAKFTMPSPGLLVTFTSVA